MLAAKKVHLPEPTMPDISLDNLARSLPEIRLPDVSLANLKRAGAELPVPDIGKAASDAAAAVGIGGRKQSRRLPRAVAGLVVAGIAAWTMLHWDAVRERLMNISRALRERIAAFQGNQAFEPWAPDELHAAEGEPA